MPRRLTLLTSCLPAFCHISWAEATAEGQIGGSASAMSAVLQLWGQQQNLMFATSNISFSFRSLKIAIDLQNGIIKVHWPVSCSPTCVSCLVYVGFIVCVCLSSFPLLCVSQQMIYQHTLTVLTEAERKSNGQRNAESSGPETPYASIKVQSTWPHQ